MQVNSQKREDIRLSILALLLAHKKGCTLQQLDKDYYEVEGEYIPWRDLGYFSLLSFLNSMPNVVQIKKENNSIIVKGIASEKSKHVTKLITEQKNVKHTVERKRYKPSHYYPRTAPPRIHIPAEILSRVISLVNEYPDGVNKNYVLQEVQKLMPSLNISKEDIDVQLYELSHKIFQRNGKIYPVQSKPNNSDNFKGLAVTSSIEFVSEEQKSSIVTVAGNENFDDTLDCSQEDDFELAPLNCSSQSLSSNSNTEIESPSSFVKKAVSECQNQILDQTSTAQIKQRASRNISELKLHKNVKEQNGNCLGNKDVEMLINDRIKLRLKKLIENHPDGIWCADLPQKYLEEYKVPLNYIELGFNSVRAFASQLPEIFNCIQPYDTGDFRLYDVHREISLNEVKEKQETMNLSKLYCIYNTSEEEALPSVVSLDTCKGLIPDEVMTIGECVGYLSVAALLESKEPYVEVVVVEVFTPSFFWIQYHKKQRMFKKFMDDLHNFYSSNYHQYVIPQIVLEKGLNCACIYNGIWHRGIIKTVKPDMQVVVMFYDYGTLKTYAAEAVYYLHRVFAYLPAQAIPCGLINVRPSEGCKWSRSATHNFALKTSQIPLIATVASINAEDNSMMVSLTDTLGEEDVHINDWLVEQKLAKYGKMVCMKKRNFPFHVYLECQEYIKQRFLITSTDKKEMNSKNKAALYNLRSSLESSHANSTNNARRTKGFAYNSSGKILQSILSNKSDENNISFEEISNCTHNCGDRPQRPSQSSYEKSIKSSFKQKSTCPTEKNDDDDNNNNNRIKSNVESDKLLESSSTTKRLTEKQSDAGLISLCHNNVELNNTDADRSFRKLESIGCKRDVELSDDKRNILQKFDNIPKSGVNHFDIQDSENDLDISYMTKFAEKCSRNDEIECTDWSSIWKNAIEGKQSISDEMQFEIPAGTSFKSRSNIPLAENYFLRAVYNSSYYDECEDKICWSPSGNISEMHDAHNSESILKDIEKRRRCMPDNMTIAIPQKILEILTGETYFDETSNISKNINEVQCINSLEEANIVTGGNLDCINDNERLHIKSLEQHLKDNIKNYYLHMKPFPPKRTLLEKLLSIADTSSCTSNLDSDDLSTLEETVFYCRDVESNYCQTKIGQYESTLETDVTCVSDSTQLKTTDLYTQESLKGMEASVLGQNMAPVENPLIDPILTNQLVKATRSVKDVNTTQGVVFAQEASSNVEVKKSIEVPIQESLTIKDTVHAQIAPVKESISSEIMTEKFYIPTFNDENIESDDEEWDVNI